MRSWQQKAKETLAETERNKLLWAKHHKLTEVRTSHPCLRSLRGGGFTRCSVHTQSTDQCPMTWRDTWPFWDHVSLWKKARIPYMLVTQPYATLDDVAPYFYKIRERLIQEFPLVDIQVCIGYDDSWWHKDATLIAFALNWDSGLLTYRNDGPWLRGGRKATEADIQLRRYFVREINAMYYETIDAYSISDREIRSKQKKRGSAMSTQFHLTDDGTGLVTDAKDEREFLDDSAQAIVEIAKKDPGMLDGHIRMWLGQIVEVSTKMRGYKAPMVQESRVLKTGWLSYAEDKAVVNTGHRNGASPDNEA